MEKDMSDELTPREKELLAKHPRDRMPLGLEGRVVDAMREKGFLSKRRRTIAITNSRVASLVAACVALIIGAYSIGLHRGGELLTPTTMEPDARVEAPPVDVEEAGDIAEVEEEAPTREKRNVATSKAQNAVEPTPSVMPDAAEKKTGGTGQLEERAEGPASGGEAPATPLQRPTKIRPDEDSPQVAGDREAPQPAAEMAIDRPLALPQSIREDLADRRLTFLLNGTPVTVEADSARVVEDRRGRILIVYTPDGIMRLRLAD